MNKNQLSTNQNKTIIIVSILIIAFVAAGFYFFFERGEKVQHEQRAGEVYIIGDEIGHKGYQGSGEAF